MRPCAIPGCIQSKILITPRTKSEIFAMRYRTVLISVNGTKRKEAVGQKEKLFECLVASLKSRALKRRGVTKGQLFFSFFLILKNTVTRFKSLFSI